MKALDCGLVATVASVALTLLFSGAARAQNATPWPELPLPPHSKTDWVAQDMKVNGVPMRVIHFESTVSRAEVAAYYTAHWSGGYRGKPSVQVQGDETVVGQMHGPYFMTLKVDERPKGASEGFLSVSRIAGVKADLSPGDLPLMPGARVVSVVESNDPGKRSRQLVVAQDAGVDMSANYYQATLGNRGWQVIEQNHVKQTDPRRAADVRLYQRDRSQLSINVAPSQDGHGSTLVATSMTKETGSTTE
jgi:hypothetical protein